ncbi:MAG: aminotransferase class III-fold pyridoxal phosphate-dependent enzyme [Rhodospirillaceae bacterium]|nr:aminotransferase class III-fold pyridoxal phosphate-dependent enzyme [Rhodospirillaceae bacterium]
MPFTPQRAFQAKPRIFTSAQGMYYRTQDGREVLDSIAGLWCVNAGHAQPAIVKAIQAQAERLDFVSSFSMSHPPAFELASRLAALAPGPLNHVFFSNSGSEAVDTALKIARGYHRARGEGGRTRFISRAKAYHGMGWGGLSVSGLARHRRDFGPFLPEVAHLSLPYDPKVSAFSQGLPDSGAHFVDELVALLATTHDPSTIAAVIVEPVTGSGGVYPPPKGYLERLRAVCDQHGILLIFDEVITGFGRVGAPFAAQAFNVTPDIMTCAKGMTNGAVPMGATIVSDTVYDAFMTKPADQIELPHGYTYSAHPLACAAALATLDVYREQALFERVGKMAGVWAKAAHKLRGARHVVDIRTIGLLAGIDLSPRPGAAGARGTEVNQACFDQGVLVRTAGDTFMLSPPFLISEEEIDRLFSTLAAILDKTA